MDNTNWTPFPDDNKLGISNKNWLNEVEAKGVAMAELEIYQLDTAVEIDAPLILKLHRIAFTELYDWAGKWRTVEVVVGKMQPPIYRNVPNLMYQFTENLQWKIANSISENQMIDTMVFAHYEFVKIHPFNNGNGRLARLLLNLVAMKFGFKPIELYHREGESRKIYITALQAADKGDFGPLHRLITENLVSF